MEFYVSPPYRRKGYGKAMLQHLEQHFSSHGVTRMYLTTGAYAEAFWRSMGFIPTGEISPENKMQIYEKDVMTFTVIPMTHDHIDFVVSAITSGKNKAALHLGDESPSAWRGIFAENLTDPDEANFIVMKDTAPVAWLKLNGLQDAQETAWLSMLAVKEDQQRGGIGSFAVRFAEDFAWQQGFKTLGIHTTADNAAAWGCYKKLGYRINEEGDCTTGDGVTRRGLSFQRDITSEICP
jgi:GNAT superfamily N-acetyltransferase